jgi:OPA family glycerol-3-phosphate transporter-like MFS transporter 1/2
MTSRCVLDRTVLAAVASFLVLLPMALVIFAFTAESLSVVCTAGLLAVLGCLVASPSNILTSAVALELSEQPAVRGNAAALHWLTIMVNGLGTVGASLGLLIVGPLQTVLNWHIIILGLAVCSVGSNMLLAPPLFRELRELYGREPKATPSPRI